MKFCRFLVILIFAITSSKVFSTESSTKLEERDTLAKRFRSLDPRPHELFPPPLDPLEKEFFQTGLRFFWFRYGISERPDENLFKGYTLYADPFHQGLKQISFLLGTDCSHFAHRLYQILGAHYPYARTRQFLALARSESRPIDILEERWKFLKDNFLIVDSSKEKLAGDLIVYEKDSGPLGAFGHMGLAVPGPRLKILHAAGAQRGIILEELSEELLRKAVFLRWKGTLQPRPENFVLGEVLGEKYDYDPFLCETKLSNPQSPTGRD